MPANIQVVLQHDVPKLGKSGELVRVRPGFARNFLLPRELALPATTGAIKRIEHDKAVAVARAEKSKKEARDLAAKIGAVTVTIAQKVGDDGRLFGSVTAKDVAAAFAAKGIEIDRRKIALPEAIKAAGSYELKVTLVSDVVASLKVEVVAK
ncbi:MAG TPA: 50S ribosomal protein L9 [Polyangiaceae bacterium]|jgi:large subunit ribosomal protein L9|nr:50S ribosomal protein L9 [Polyangiaceae bacterium]